MKSAFVSARSIRLPSHRTMSVQASAAPAELHYFPIRGRMEPVRLILQVAKVPYADIAVDRDQMKNNLDLFPFAQCPRYKDELVDISQSNTIIRYLGRKHGMYGATPAEQALVDMVLDGAEALRARHSTLVYGEKLEATARATYIETHVNPATMNGRNGGAHWGYLARLLKNNHGGNAFFVGDKMTIADIQMFDLIDIHTPASVIGAELAGFYPELMAFHARMKALPEIRAYVHSDRRFAKTNNNGLGDVVDQ